MPSARDRGAGRRTRDDRRGRLTQGTRLSIEAHLDYLLAEPADVLFALEVAQVADQRLIEDRLVVDGVGPLTPVAAEHGIGRRTWAHGYNRVAARYTALLEVERLVIPLAGLATDPMHRLPPDVVPYLWPSRYCDSDRFEAPVAREFGHLAGGDKVLAIAQFVGGYLRYLPGVSGSTTTASDTYVQRQGVCRDFAHLLIAMIRAADIPARMVGAYALGVSPPDFHAVVEVWLDGAWHLVDPTSMAEPAGIVRIGVGRDATDVAFLTIFGRGELIEQSVRVEAAPRG